MTNKLQPKSLWHTDPPTQFRGHGLFLKDALIAVIPASPRGTTTSQGRRHTGEAPVITEEAMQEGYRWAPLWELIV